MKIRLVFAHVALAISFVLSAFAQLPPLPGHFVTFDAPGAVNGTTPVAMNPGGTITGFYFDANFVPHGFLRAQNGSFTTFDAPGAATNNLQGTYATSINLGGPSQDSTLTQTLFLTASCGPPTAR